MSKEGKILSAISLVIIVLLLLTSMFLYITKESEVDKKMALQKQVEELTAKEQVSEAKLKEMEIVNAQMGASIKFQEEKINTLTRELESEKEVRGKNLASIQAKEAEAENLKAKVEEIKAEKEDIVKNLEKLNEEYLNMKFHLENLIKTKEEMEAKAKELSEKEGISLGTVIVRQVRN